MTDTKLRDEIVRIGESIFDRELTFGSTGNISVKTDDGWLQPAFQRHLETEHFLQFDSRVGPTIENKSVRSLDRMAGQ